MAKQNSVEWVTSILSAIAGIFLLANAENYTSLKAAVIVLGIFALFPLIYRLYNLFK